MAKQDYPRLTTPRGTFIYPKLVEPDTKYVKPHGEYSTKFALELDDAETTAFIERLEEILQAYIDENPKDLKPAVIKKAGRNDLFEEECDDEGEETGRAIFRFKLAAKVETETKSWDQKPRLFDAAAQPIEDGSVNPWTGTEGKCNIEVFPYFMQSQKVFGLSLRLKGAQILKLVQGEGASADDMGFGAEDGGYVRQQLNEESGFEPTGEDGGEEDEDF